MNSKNSRGAIQLSGSTLVLNADCEFNIGAPMMSRISAVLVRFDPAGVPTGIFTKERLGLFPRLQIGIGIGGELRSPPLPHHR